jgi:hypothetical protein
MMYIISVPENTDLEQMPEDLQRVIAEHGGEFPTGLLVGTQPFNGRQLHLINVNLDKETLEAITSENLFDEEGNQYGFDLDWNVLAVENEVVDQTILLQYFVSVPKIDIEDLDAELIYEPVLDLTDKLQTWAGRKWVY